MTERASLWSDADTRLRLRELAGRWRMTMQEALRRLVQEALAAEQTRESGASAAAEQ